MPHYVQQRNLKNIHCTASTAWAQSDITEFMKHFASIGLLKNRKKSAFKFNYQLVDSLISNLTNKHQLVGWPFTATKKRDKITSMISEIISFVGNRSSHLHSFKKKKRIQQHHWPWRHNASSAHCFIVSKIFLRSSSHHQALNSWNPLKFPDISIITTVCCM